MNRKDDDDRTVDTVDLATCQAERIHVPGAIQPHGCLICCGLQAWTITSISANADTFFGREPSDLLGLPLEAVLPHKTLHDLRNLLQAAIVSGGAERLAGMPIDGTDARYDLTVHAAGQDAIIEILHRAGTQSPAADPLLLVKSMIGRLKRAATFDRFLGLAASQVRAVTGFDRVMIYRFLEDQSGQVVAESLRSGMTPFLGLRYPASDIPAQARALYKRQWLRLIPDVAYTPVPLLSEPGRTNEVDLSLAGLRSVSPIHLEYLRNMGSQATLTVSLVEGDELWGLIACHHEQPRRVSSMTCAVAELFGQILSLQIEARERKQQFDQALQARQAHDRLLSSMPPEETLFDNPERFREILQDIIPCDGIGVWSDGVISDAGTVPPAEMTAALVHALDRQAANAPFATDSLEKILGPAQAGASDIAGVLAIPVSRMPRDYLLFYRREVAQTVTWGGNPNKPVEAGDGGTRLGPRRSFEAWRETVRGRSLPWRPEELRLAEALRVSLLEVILRRADVAVRERKAVQETQTFLIAELNHRVKNILALIRSLVRQSRRGARSAAEFANDLEQRVQALAFAHDQLTSTGWTKAPLRKLLDAEVKAWTDAPDRVALEGPSVSLDSRAFQALALVIHEMMTNAAKHGCLSRATGRLTITWALDCERNLRLQWRERGGPPVRAPEARGFGSVVIGQTIPFELNGEAELDYRPDGLVGRFMVPAIHVGEEDEAPEPIRAEAGHSDVALKRLLLVEDSMMIALDAQAMLRESGIEVHVAGTSADAHRSLTVETFDAAVLDINLSGERSFGVADEIADLGLPFVFATGYGENCIVPERFKTVPVVSKPYDKAALHSALRSMGESGGAGASQALDLAGSHARGQGA